MEFLTENHILGKEVCDYLNMHTANISILDFEKYGIVKIGDTILFDTKARVPRYVNKYLREQKPYNLKNCLPVAYVKNEFGMSDSGIMEFGIVEEKFKHCGKQFFRFKEDFIKRIKRKTFYVANSKEFNEMSKDLYDFYYKSKQTYLVFY